MLIREALKIIRSTQIDKERKVSLICSFEPLHLKTHVQAFLALKFSHSCPEVLTFGYDQLERAFTETSSDFKNYSALLCLTWEDMHPGLSWRGRGELGNVGLKALEEGCRQLKNKLMKWGQLRQGSETYLALPSMDWMPLHDSCAISALGQVSVTASAFVWELVRELSGLGVRILKPTHSQLSYKDLINYGCPLSAETSESLANDFVTLAFNQPEKKKVIITDLDGTLWKGVIGEVGPKGVEMSPHGLGYPFYIYQNFLRKLKQNGVIIAFCSKNNESDVLPVFDSMKMPLRMSDFATFRCNWKSKPENIISIATELNIGLDSIVMVDDNDVELEEIKHKIPAVTLVRTPTDTQDWKEVFNQLQNLFSTWHLTEEDRTRNESYKNEKTRKQFLEKVKEDTLELGTLQDDFSYLKNLKLEIIFNEMGFDDPRSLELVNKTNQFNLTGERISVDEWLRLSKTQGSFCLSARLKDQFGDFGTISVLVGHSQDHSILIRQFVLSCRAFGRGVEVMMLNHVLANTKHDDWICGPFKDTGKNEPLKLFLEKMGACTLGSAESEWKLSRETICNKAHIFMEHSHILCTKSDRS